MRRYRRREDLGYVIELRVVDSNQAEGQCLPTLQYPGTNFSCPRMAYEVGLYAPIIV